MEQTYFTKYLFSILYRQGNRFYDRELAKYNIGYGQQFYLPRIYENTKGLACTSWPGSAILKTKER